MEDRKDFFARAGEWTNEMLKAMFERGGEMPPSGVHAPEAFSELTHFLLLACADYDDTTQTYRLTAKGRWFVLKNIINDGSWRRILRKNGLWNFIKMVFGLK